MNYYGLLIAAALLVSLLINCDGPDVGLPVKSSSASDADDIDDEAEEATRGLDCETDSDCPGTENPICSSRLGCVECTSNDQCPPGEICITFIGDCEDPPRTRGEMRDAAQP